jgi:hypothetical protein
MPRVAPPRQIAPYGGACAAKGQEPLPLVNIVIVFAHQHIGTAQMVVEQVVERAIGANSDGLPRQHVGGTAVRNGASVACLLVGWEWVLPYSDTEGFSPFINQPACNTSSTFIG